MNNPFLDGLRSGQAAAQGFNNMINGSPIQNALTELQNGGDAAQIYQKLLAQDPQSAQQFMNFIQMQNSRNDMQSGGQTGIPMGSPNMMIGG